MEKARAIRPVICRMNAEDFGEGVRFELRIQDGERENVAAPFTAPLRIETKIEADT